MINILVSIYRVWLLQLLRSLNILKGLSHGSIFNYVQITFKLKETWKVV